ncbi:hypothetical protein MTYP_03289 [Methylophilaceae bacterium]|nr:hypothetical protein MTYP_03289 [Methylophilaceae bacterium]
MQAKSLLKKLLEAESEEDVVAVLSSEGLLQANNRWKYLGNMPNNQSIVHGQQSTPSAALVEKFTNGLDAILLKHCKARGIDPRSAKAPANMADAIDRYFGDLSDVTKIRSLAEDNLILYATGSKSRPCLSLYDAGEGQLAENFPTTFCSLIYGSADGSYKGAIPFVQGRFNMGGTGVLPFCSDKYKLQLIVSRVPDEVAKSTGHEWAYTLFCFFASKQNPSWKYLVGTDGQIQTAGSGALALVPKLNAKSGEICAPRERMVSSGSLIKMYDYKAPRSNICGELFKKLQEYLLCPSLPLRIIECRESYRANVMGVNVWDRFGIWSRSKKLEAGFEEGASISIKLDTGEIIPAEVRVFKSSEGSGSEEDQPQTGLRALINGQSHAKRDAQFFRTKAVDKEHIAGSMLVTLDCSELGQDSRNNLFMSNRETFREDPLLLELFKKLQKELHDHEGLIQLNQKRYEEKIKNAVDDEQGISALEELLSTDPTLADLFGSKTSGKVAARTSTDGVGGKIEGDPVPFKGLDFPTFIYRRDKSTCVELNIPRGEITRVSFLTDVKNNYFSRQKHRGMCTFEGDFEPSFHLYNGKLTFTCSVDKHLEIGRTISTKILISDNKNSGPFHLSLSIKVEPERIVVEETEKPESSPKPPKVQAGPSRPDIIEMDKGPDAPPLTIEKVPNTERLQLVLNTTSHFLDDAKKMRPKEEELAVGFVFKYGLALTAMGLLDSMKKSDEWQTDESSCRGKVEESAKGIARVIVPLCLSLPKKLPKQKG